MVAGVWESGDRSSRLPACTQLLREVGQLHVRFTLFGTNERWLDHALRASGESVDGNADTGGERPSRRGIRWLQPRCFELVHGRAERAALSGKAGVRRNSREASQNSDVA